MTVLERQEQLNRIFEADRAVRQAEQALLSAPDQSELQEVLVLAAEEAKSLGDSAENALRLTRLADLCAQVAGPRMVDTLISILNVDNPSIRVAAGEALLDVGYERYAEVARGVERALEGNFQGPAMAELPFVLAEIAEPSALALIKRFLAHDDADVVAAGIEALVELGDPAAVDAIHHLTEDTREVSLDDAEGVETETTIGELATEACEELQAREQE